MQQIQCLPVFKYIYIDHKEKIFFNSNDKCSQHQEITGKHEECKDCQKKGCRFLCTERVKNGYICGECKQLQNRIDKSLQRLKPVAHQNTPLNKLNQNQLVDSVRRLNGWDKIFTKEIIKLRKTLDKYHDIVSRDADGNKLIKTVQLILNNWDRFDIYFQKFPQHMDHIYDQFNFGLHKQNGTLNGQRWTDSSKLLHTLQRMHLSSYEAIRETNIQGIPTKPTLNRKRQEHYFGDGMSHGLCEKMKKERKEYCNPRGIKTEPYYIMQLDGMTVAEVMAYNPKNHSITGQLSKMYEWATAASIYDLFSEEGGMKAANNELQALFYDVRSGFTFEGPSYAYKGEWSGEQLYSIIMDILEKFHMENIGKLKVIIVDCLKQNQTAYKKLLKLLGMCVVLIFIVVLMSCN